MYFLDRSAKEYQTDKVRDHHHRVEAVRHVPYKVNLCKRAQDYANSYKNRINFYCFWPEQILYVRLAEEIPADDR